MRNCVFKTEEGREKFLACYNGILSRFPFEQRYAGISFGRTFMITAGLETAPPAV